MIGTFQDTVVRKIGELDYRFPKAKAQAVYLWLKRITYETWPAYYRDPYWFYPYPFWCRYPYWW